MIHLVSKIYLPILAYAGEGSGHGHGPNGETEHLYPVLGVFLVLIIGGLAFHFFSKKKK